MRKLGLAIALAGVAVPMGASAQSDDIVATLLETAKTLFQGQGYRSTEWVQRGAIPDAAEVRHFVELTGGREYAFIGVCDQDCEDLDMEIVDAGGRSVGEDVEDDDSPIVSFTAKANQRYQIILRMADCTEQPCYYGVRSFQK